MRGGSFVFVLVAAFSCCCGFESSCRCLVLSIFLFWCVLFAPFLSFLPPVSPRLSLIAVRVPGRITKVAGGWALGDAGGGVGWSIRGNWFLVAPYSWYM